MFSYFLLKSLALPVLAFGSINTDLRSMDLLFYGVCYYVVVMFSMYIIELVLVWSYYCMQNPI